MLLKEDCLQTDDAIDDRVFASIDLWIESKTIRQHRFADAGKVTQGGFETMGVKAFCRDTCALKKGQELRERLVIVLIQRTKRCLPFIKLL